MNDETPEFFDTSRCPNKDCGSTKIRTLDSNAPLSIALAKIWKNRVVAELCLCLDCSSLWEPFADGTHKDCVARARMNNMCNNCAFRKSSIEMQDADTRAELLSFVEKTHDFFGTDTPIKWFACHKGVPIKISKADGAEFDFSCINDTAEDRTCAGFLRSLWALKRARARAVYDFPHDSRRSGQRRPRRFEFFD